MVAVSLQNANVVSNNGLVLLSLYAEVWILVLRAVPAPALDLLPAMPRRLPGESALEEQAGGEHDATGGGGGEREVTSQRLKENKNRHCPMTCGTDKFVKW